jgi:hypothetical protein
MACDVGECFLDDPVGGSLNLETEPAGKTAVAQINLHIGLGAKALDMPEKRGQQAQVIEHRQAGA